MEIKPIKTRIFRENEDLFSFVLQYVKKIPENSILAVTSKIVALSEGRTAQYKNQATKVKLIKEESDFALNERKMLFSLKMAWSWHLPAWTNQTAMAG